MKFVFVLAIFWCAVSAKPCENELGRKCLKNSFFNQTTGKCQCNRGYIDILKTSLPERHQFEPGQVCVEKKPCYVIAKPMSVIFAMDYSGSMQYLADQERAFVQSAADYLPWNAKVAFFPFANSVVENPWITDFRLNKDKVPELSLTGGTNTPAVLEAAVRRMREESADVLKYVILITDGDPGNWQATRRYAKELQTIGVRLMIVGVNGYDNIRNMNSLVTNPRRDIFDLTATGGMQYRNMKNISESLCYPPTLLDF